MNHSPIGGSVQHRVLNCHGSVHLSRCATKSTGAAAERGNVMHAHAAAILTDGPIPGTPLRKGEREIVDCYVAGVPRDMQPHIEERIENPSHPWLFGTVDAYWIDEAGILNIADLKTGKTPVSVVNNPQLMFYTYLMRMDLYTPVRHWICQPLAGGWTSHMVTEEEYAAFVMDLERLLDSLNQENDIALRAGEWCGYCPAKKDLCPLYRQPAAVVDDSF